MPNEPDNLKRNSVVELMREIGEQARQAAGKLATAKSKAKSDALLFAAGQLLKNETEILAANTIDVANGQTAKLSNAMIDRLRLDEARIIGIAEGLRAIAALPDPVGEVIAKWDRPNGLEIERVRTPLGVVGVIYESRPNVTVDAGALCLMAGNAAILRGGSDSLNSSTALYECLSAGLASQNLPAAAIQLVPTTSRDAVGEMLAGLGGNLDVLVPRGGKSLVQRVQNESRVPVFAHLDGICHVYVDGEAELEMAKQIVINSKMRRTGICGAAETLLIDKNWERQNAKALIQSLAATGCEIRGDATTNSIFDQSIPASESDWSTEYLDSIISIKFIDGVTGAIEHIGKYSTHHTESIVTESTATAERFLGEIDSAILLHNASTQFADGGEFGMGAEIGIATGKMHARGPVGVEQLTSFNYRVRGSGQTRPT
ncbi:MAG: glutamate-5-semialdehyde dehydrogenase [Mariniblastus sp.]